MSGFAIGQLAVAVIFLGIGSYTLFANERVKPVFLMSWMTGLFLIICGANSSWLVLLAAIAIFISGHFCRGENNSFGQLVPDDASHIVGICLTTIGSVISLISKADVVHGIGVLSTIVGIGGALNWFPFPLAKSHNQSRLTFINQQIIPVLAGAVFLLRITTLANWNDQELAFLAVASMFSLGIIALRVHSHVSKEKLPTLCTLAILSHANVATILARWNVLHTQADWSDSSNLPTGLQIFVAILVVESLAVLVLIAPESDRMGPTGIASLSLAGIPPFPGAWWRFALLTSLLLPHHRSSLTSLTEPHRGFLALGVVNLAILVILGTGQISSSLKVSDHTGVLSAKNKLFNWSLAVVLLIAGTLSLSIQPWFQRLF